MSAPASQQQQTARKPRSTKPAVIKAAVLVRRVSGQSKSQIAKDLDITRNCVKSIIEEGDIDQLVERGVISCKQLIAKAVDVIDYRLDKKSETAAFGILNPLVLHPADKQGNTTNITYNFAIMQGRKDAP